MISSDFSFKMSFKKLKEFDIGMTNALAICSNPKPDKPKLILLRYLLIALEISFHGVPWFMWLIYLYLAEDRNIKAIFFGKLKWFKKN